MAHNHSTTERQSYHSPLREQQVQQVHDQILAAAGEVVATKGLSDFSIPAVATQAGVAIRTVYRHFPTRQALLEALTDWVSSQIGATWSAVDHVEALPEQVEQLFERFDQQQALLSAYLAASDKPSSESQ